MKNTAPGIPNEAWPASREEMGCPSDSDISNAYVYLLGRLLILRQQRRDFEEEGFKWNTLIHHERGGVNWSNPNLDVACSEAWVAIDGQSCLLLDIPRIDSRYYTWQMLNGWGEVVLNINERTFPWQPHGHYALCLKGSRAKAPDGALRIDLPAKAMRVLLRVELGANPKETVRLQRECSLTSVGQPRIENVIETPVVPLDRLPGVEVFDRAEEILSGEPDINPGMEKARACAKAVTALLKSGKPGRERVESVLKADTWPVFMRRAAQLNVTTNGWVRATVVGNYGSNYWMRSIVNFVGIWGNSSSEVVYFGATGLDGAATYTQTFAKAALPSSKAQYFWSVIAVDAKDYRAIPDSTNKHLLNNQSPLQYNADGSLTLAYAPKPPEGVPETNWLPTVEDKKYNLTFRFYGPVDEVSDARYFPPPLMKGNG